MKRFPPTARWAMIPAALLVVLAAGWSYRFASKEALPSQSGIEQLRQASLLHQLRPRKDRLDQSASPLIALYVRGRYAEVISTGGESRSAVPVPHSGSAPPAPQVTGSAPPVPKVSDQGLRSPEGAGPLARAALDEILIGNSLALLGLWEEARPYYEKVLAGPFRADAYANLALVFSTQQKWREGIAAGVEALSRDQELGDIGAQASDLGMLATLASRLGDQEKAMKAHRRALELAVQAKDTWQEATEHASLGTLHYFQRELDSALAEHQEALRLYRAAGDPIGAVHALNGIGVLYKESGKTGQAIEYFKQSQTEYKTIGDREGEATAWVNLALIQQEQGDFSQAIRFGQNALHLEREGKRPLRVAVTLGTLGMIQKSAGNLPEAIRYLEEALALLKEAGASQQVHNVELQLKALRDQQGP